MLIRANLEQFGFDSQIYRLCSFSAEPFNVKFKAKVNERFAYRCKKKRVKSKSNEKKPWMLFRLKEETSALMKDRDHIQYKLEKNIIFQQYLEKVLEAAEEVFVITTR